MKYFFLLSTLISAFTLLGAEAEFPRVNPQLYIFRADTNFDRIKVQNDQELERRVREVFEKDLFNNEDSKAFDPNADFAHYFKRYKTSFQLIDLNRDGVCELIYNGLMNSEDPKEYLEIYAFTENHVRQIYSDAGWLFAFKIQPNTKEIILYSHQYPCCSNGSHYIYRLRMVEGKMHFLKRFFVARQHDMKGDFFPDKIFDSGKYQFLAKKVALRWSSEVIATDAWTSRTKENRICWYKAGTPYKLLARRGKWKFILVKGPPEAEQGNLVIRPENFLDTWIYGWMQD